MNDSNIDPLLQDLPYGGIDMEEKAVSEIFSTICVQSHHSSKHPPESSLTRSHNSEENTSAYEPSQFAEVFGPELVHLIEPFGTAQPPAPPLAGQRKRIREKTSWTWEEEGTIHGKKVMVDGEYLWECAHCVNRSKPQRYYLNSGSNPRAQHLNKIHSIFEKLGKKKSRLEASGKSIKDAMRRVEMAVEQKKFSSKESMNEVQTFDPKVMTDLLIRLISQRSLPFTFATSSQFHDFISYIRPDIIEYLPSSSARVQTWTMEAYSLRKFEVMKTLQQAESEINYTLDSWSSPNHLALLGIIAHYTDGDGELRDSTVAIKVIEGAHTGANMAQIVIQVLEDFGITSKTGFGVMDNATNNDTLWRTLGTYLNGLGLQWDHEQRRLRCIGHIINLTVKDFLFGHKEDDFIQQAFNEDSANVMEAWRQHGPLGKIHNVITHIRGSPQRIADFKERSDGLLPHPSNNTRWNSWYELLAGVLQPPVVKAIDLYVYDHGLEYDRLSKQDWDMLDRIRRFLLPFQKATLSTENRQATLAKVLPAMDMLMAHYDQAIKENSLDPVFTSMLYNGRSKLEKYYSLAKRSAPCIAAVILSPKLKWRYFEDRWHKNDIQQARDIMQSFWNIYYKPNGPLVHHITPIEALVNDPALDDLDAWMQPQLLHGQSDIDELDQYCSSPPELGANDSRRWWMEERVRQYYPNLSKLGIDIHSVPAMSAEPERLFSAAKHTIGTLRGRLGIETIEALECLKSWDRVRS